MLNSHKSLVVASVFLAIGASVGSAQQSPDGPSYLEVTWMQVKQDKVAEFGQLAKRVAEANRRGKGDRWIAFMDFYGRDNSIWMASLRTSLAEVEPAGKSFMKALQQQLDYTPDRFMAETARMFEASGSELLRFRFDLGWNVKDADDWTAHLAKSKYLVFVTVHVKPGHMLDAEKQIGMLRDAIVAHAGTPGSVAQLVLGGDPGTFVIRSPLENVAGLAEMPTPRSVLGGEGYKQYSEMLAQNFSSVDYALKRMVPEWSNPPDSFVKANPDMWGEKPSATVRKPRPAAGENKKPAPAGQ